MDQRLALGACTPQIAPPGPPSPNQPSRTPPLLGKSPPRPPHSLAPPPPQGASYQRLVGGVVGIQNRGVPPPGHYGWQSGGVAVIPCPLVFWGACWPVALYCHVLRLGLGYVCNMCSVLHASC